MSLLFRLLGFVTLLIFRLLARLALRLLRLLLPVALAVLGWLLNLVTTAFVATVTGPRAYIERQASEWTRRLIALGVSPDHLDIAHGFCRFLSASMIVLGWIVATLFTVAVVRVVFGCLFC